MWVITFQMNSFQGNNSNETAASLAVQTSMSPTHGVGLVEYHIAEMYVWSLSSQGRK